MKFSKVILCGILLINVPPLAAQTNVSGNLSTSTTWNLIGSPYTLTGDVWVMNNATLTIASGVVVKGGYGIAVGSNGAAGFLQANGVTFTNVQMSFNLQSSGTLTNCTFTSANIYVTDNASPAITNNTFDANSHVTLGSPVATPTINGNTFADKTVYVSGMNVSQNVVWNKYQDCSSTLTGDVWVMNNATLTIASGVVVKGGYGIAVGSNGAAGFLQANGVTFTNVQMSFNLQSSGTLTNCTFTSANIYVTDNASPAITNNTFDANSHVTLGSPVATPTINGNTFADKTVYVSGMNVSQNVVWNKYQDCSSTLTGDVWVMNNATLTIASGVVVKGGYGIAVGSNGAAGFLQANGVTFTNVQMSFNLQSSGTLTNCTFTSANIYVTDNASPAITNNTFDANSHVTLGSPVATPTINGNTFADKTVYVSGMNVSQNVVWNKYQDCSSTLTGDVWVMNNATLTIASGVVVKGGYGIAVGSNGAAGFLQANGVTFTNVQMSFNLQSSGTLTNCTFTSANIYVTDNTSLNIGSSNIDKQCSVNNTSPVVVGAQGNYWGDATGPTNPSNPAGKGAQVIGQVMFVPFATTPFSPGGRDTVQISSISVLIPTAEVDVPQWGTGYKYFSLASSSSTLSYAGSVSIPMTLQSKGTVNLSGFLLDTGLLRVDIPDTILSNRSVANGVLSFADHFTAGNHTYIFNSAPSPITAHLVTPIYNRKWTFFAQGSAGVSGKAGAFGIVGTVAAAELSIKGKGSTQLSISSDETGALTFGRELQFGISASLNIPAVDLVVGQVHMGPSVTAGFDVIVGQEFSPDVLSATTDQKKMAAAGFVLETAALGLSDVSPTFGVVIKAISGTLLNASGMSAVLKAGTTRQYWGGGIESSLDVGIDLSVGSKKVANLGSVGLSGDLQGIYNRYGSGSTNTTSSFSLTWGGDVNLSLLNMPLKFNDHVNLDPAGVTSNSGSGLVDVGVGMEAGGEAFLSTTSTLDSLNLWLEGSGGIATPVDNLQLYHKTKWHIDGQYVSNIRQATTGIRGFVDDAYPIPIADGFAQDIQNAVSSCITSFVQAPVSITTTENRGMGYELPLDIDLGVALGVGIGVDIGLDFRYYDEVEYIKKYTEVYANGKNYLLYSADYNSTMRSASLSQIFQDILTGAVTLAKTALVNLCNTVQQAVDAGKQFVVNAVNSAGKTVGKIAGSIAQKGQWLVTTFSPNSPRTWTASFTKPVVRQMYYATKVKHRAPNEAQGYTDASTILVLVSDNMKVSFVPDGQSSSLDSLSTPFAVKMVVDTAQLSSNGFTQSDIPRIELYRYDQVNRAWILEGGALTGDTVSANVYHLASYALGIELTNTVDVTPPTIKEYGPKSGSILHDYPMIYAKIQDDQYGVGVDWTKTFILVNGDTVKASFDPANQEIYYTLTSADHDTGSLNVAILTADYSHNAASIQFTITVLTSVGPQQTVHQFALSQNYPNPFNPSTQIQYSVAKESSVDISLYNAIGQFVGTLVSKRASAGVYTEIIDGSKLASGTYFCSFAAKPTDGSSEYRETRKILLVK